MKDIKWNMCGKCSEGGSSTQKPGVNLVHTSGINALRATPVRPFPLRAFPETLLEDRRSQLSMQVYSMQFAIHPWASNSLPVKGQPHLQTWQQHLFGTQKNSSWKENITRDHLEIIAGYLSPKVLRSCAVGFLYTVTAWYFK